jgi:DNA-directed RNA polymerase specialized sigma24 family protein
LDAANHSHGRNDNSDAWLSHSSKNAVQEAWVRAFTRLDTWSGNQAFGAWLRGITIHVAIDLLRHELRLSFTDDVDVGVPEHSFEGIDLERAIPALAPGYRAVLVLHDIEGFTHEETPDSTDSFVLRIGTGTTIKLHLKKDSTKASGKRPGLDEKLETPLR